MVQGRTEPTSATTDVNPYQTLGGPSCANNSEVLGAHSQHRVPATKKAGARLVVHLGLSLIELVVRQCRHPRSRTKSYQKLGD